MPPGATTVRDDRFGCELFVGRLDEDGYGRIGRRQAHIVEWEAEHGAVPAGQVLDHLCRRRRCVALHHLEPVDQSENEKRKSWRYRVRRVWCRFMHDLRLHAVVTPEMGRVCRLCNRAAATVRALRAKDANAGATHG